LARGMEGRDRREIDLPSLARDSSAFPSPRRRGHRLRRPLPTLTTGSPPQDPSLPPRVSVPSYGGQLRGVPGLVVEFSALASQIYADARTCRRRARVARNFQSAISLIRPRPLSPPLPPPYEALKRSRTGSAPWPGHGGMR